MTGLAVDSKYIYIAYQSRTPGLLRIDKTDFSCQRDYKFSKIVDPHSILSLKDRLLIVSSGTDSVYEVFLGEDEIERESYFWSLSGKEEGSDMHHINSITKFDRDILVSGFGSKTNDSWKETSNGFIFNINRGEYLRKGIYHPHSLHKYKGSLYYCESVTRSLWRNETNILKLESGYIRGLSISRDFIVVGSSTGRKKSKSSGKTFAISGEGIIDKSCGIIVYERKNLKVLHSLDFTSQYTEIYDIVRIK
ncbi:MAG: DUF4915 domain-containing protein [Candidatus Dojkabacteria bacterium]